MSHETLTADERERVLRAAGLAPELIATVEHSTTSAVAAIVAEAPTYTCVECGQPITVADNLDGGLITVNVNGHGKPAHRTCPSMAERRNTVAVNLDGETTVIVSDVVKEILTKARGNKDHALQLVDAYITTEFDRIKLSKMQAAAQGMTDGPSIHNKAAWKHCQALRDTIKTQVRAVFREQGGFVKAKIIANRSEGE